MTVDWEESVSNSQVTILQVLTKKKMGGNPGDDRD